MKWHTTTQNLLESGELVKLPPGYQSTLHMGFWRSSSTPQSRTSRHRIGWMLPEAQL